MADYLLWRLKKDGEINHRLLLLHVRVCPKTYTVTADYKDGKTVITGTYDYGATYTCPTNNIKKGYTLKSWTKK